MSASPASPRWGGKQPEFTPARQRAIRDLRAWERHPTWDADRRDRARCQSWGFFGHRLAAGKFHPYAVAPAARDELRGKHGLSPLAIRVLELLVGARVGYGIRVVVGDHAKLARLLSASERWTGEALRSLSAAGLVERRTHFRRAGLGHAQLACSWKVRKSTLKRLGALRFGLSSPKPTEPFISPVRGCSLSGGGSIHPQSGPAPDVGAPQALKRLQSSLEHQVLAGIKRGNRVYTEAAKDLARARAAFPPPANGCAFHRPRAKFGACLDCDELRETERLAREAN